MIYKTFKESGLDDDPVVVVRFNSGGKTHHYYTDIRDFEPGEVVNIISCNRAAVVKVVGYCDHEEDARIWLNVRDRPYKQKPYSFAQNEQDPFMQDQPKQTHTQEKTTMSDAIQSTKRTLTSMKNTAIKLQKGNTTITAIKTAVLALETTPPAVKALMITHDGITDAVIGAVLQVAAETFTDSGVIADAARDASFAGAVSLSSELTIIQDMVESFIVATLAKGTAKKK